MREVVNALFYLTPLRYLRSGCAWRLLPHDFPPWSTVHDYYRHWRLEGTWQRIHDALRLQVHVQTGRNPEPAAAM
jgi:putative transposase